MPTVADIFIRYRTEYLRAFGPGLLPSHRRTIRNIVKCRTEALGGSLYRCSSCGRKHYSYHSCNDRHCPRCGQEATERWARKLSARVPRVPCFLLTFTVPHELSRLIRSHQKDLYGLMFRTAADSLRTLCADPRHLGAAPGMVGVLHTWGRDMSYHPHVHFLVPAGGLDSKGRWVPTRYRDFLVPVQALSIIFRAKFRDGLKALGLYELVPAQIWRKRWVVHCEAAGQGPELIGYLARYVHRVAIANSNIVSLEQDHVTFRYQPSGTKLWKTMRLPALAFMARFLQHVLPRGFAKVRYYGWLHPRCTHKRLSLHNQLGLPPPPSPVDPPQEPMRCVHCHSLLLRIGALPRVRAPP